MPPTPEFKKVVVDKLILNRLVPSLADEYPSLVDNLTVSYSDYRITGGVLHHFKTFLNNVETVEASEKTLYKYPSSPWEFYKEKYAPKWVLKKWPVDYTTKKVEVVRKTTNHMCPHLSLSDQYPHVLFLYEGYNKFPLTENKTTACLK